MTAQPIWPQGGTRRHPYGTTDRPRMILVTRKHRCPCRGWAHRIFGTQHDCLSIQFGGMPLFCSRCPCSDFNPKTVLAVVPHRG